MKRLRDSGLKKCPHAPVSPRGSRARKQGWCITTADNCGCPIKAQGLYFPSLTNISNQRYIFWQQHCHCLVITLNISAVRPAKRNLNTEELAEEMGKCLGAFLALEVAKCCTNQLRFGGSSDSARALMGASPLPCATRRRISLAVVATYPLHGAGSVPALLASLQARSHHSTSRALGGGGARGELQQEQTQVRPDFPSLRSSNRGWKVS